MERVRLATIWFGGCSGCHMSFLDIDELLIDLLDKIEIVFSPIVDVKEYPENVDVCLVEGAVCNEEHIELAHKIRARTRIICSFGDCAVTSNVCGMRNALGPVKIPLEHAYVGLADYNQGIPHEPGIVPPMLDKAIPLHEVIPVDQFLPGCPPSAEQIKTLVLHLLGAGEAPAGKLIKFG
jgi:NAD-reducing hydrogenase small subunit